MTRLSPGEDGPHPTYCRLCEALCGLTAQVEGGRIIKVGPDRGHPVSSGHLCVKGPGMMHVTYDPDRVMTPLKRVGGPGVFEPVSWDEALDDIATRLVAITDRHGQDSLAMFMGNPAAFDTLHYHYAGGFMMAFNSAKMHSPLHVDTGPKHLASELIYNRPDRFTFPDLERCDFLFMLGANPMVTHMSLISEPRALHKLQDIAKRGGVVVVDPRRTETAERFEHVPIKPDTDAWLLGAMLNSIFAEGLTQTPYLEDHVTGWRDLADAVTWLTPELAETQCGVPADDIRTLARRFASAPTAACYGRIGTNRGSFSTITTVFIEALNLATGRFGQPGGWVFGEAPLGDSPGGAPYGAKRSRIGKIPLINGMTPGAELAADIMTPGDGQTRALFVDSANPVLSHPQGSKTQNALEQLELMVALDFYMNETTQHAHYILPCVTFLERADINNIWTVNAPRPFLQYTDAVIEPMGESRDPYDIYGDILARAGRPPTFAPDSPERPDLFDVVTASFASRKDGLTLETLKQEYPSGIRLAEFVDAEASWGLIRHDDGKAHLWHPIIADEIGRLSASARPHDDRLRLFGRRKLRSLNSWMHNDMRLVRSDKPTLLIHPDDARDRQISGGQRVRVASTAGAIEVEAEISDEVIAGSVNYPHGWGHHGGWKTAAGLPGADVNELASSDPKDWEQVSGMPLLDGIPVEVTPLPA